jgi:hypothetical protein
VIRKRKNAAPTPPSHKQLRLLVVSGNLALLRGHYDEVIASLARAGVDVRIRYVKENLLDPAEYAAAFQRKGLKVSVERLPRVARRPADSLSLRLRELGNVLRFSHPDYAGRTVLSERALLKTGPGVRRWGKRLRHLGNGRSAAAARVLRSVESVLPAPIHACDLVARERPDAIAAAPVIRVPGLVDFLKAGAEAGIPTASWVQSWDNLTNKGLMHFTPDRVFVWNHSQVSELERYHGISAGHVCVTGAQTFDHWFSDQPIDGRDEFCAELGVDPARPIVLYLASSKQIAPDEPSFFAVWLRALRETADSRLRSATILVRPHPTLARRWHAEGFEDEPGVVLSPSTLSDQINSDAFRARYRAELHHASVAVGINTSGLIDAAIFGKPAFAVELEELFHGQRGTVHFELLARPEGGLLRTAKSLSEHIEALAEALGRDTYARDEKSMSFVRTFVRPRGFDVRPTDVFVDEMLTLLSSRPVTSPVWGARRMLGAVIARSAVFAGAPLEDHPFESIVGHFVDRFDDGYRRLRGFSPTQKGRRKPLRKRLRRRSRRLAYGIAVRVLPVSVRRGLRRAVGARGRALPKVAADDVSVGSETRDAGTS